MRNENRLYGTAEVAALTGVGYSVVTNAITKRLIVTSPGRETTAPNTKRKVSKDDMLRLKIWHETGFGPAHLRELYQYMTAEPHSDFVRVGPLLIVDVGAAKRQLDAKIADLEAAEALVTRDDEVLNGEPVFAGTRIMIREIAMLLNASLSEEEILKRYPGLNSTQLKAAPVWAAAHPHHGRPKSLSRLKSSD